MTIRRWKQHDLNQIMELLHELNDALNEDQPIDLSALNDHFNHMERYPELYENAVFEENGTVIGFISIVYYRSVYHRKGTALINELVVSEAHRGKKIGERLLEYAIQRARTLDMDEIEVGVMPDNSGAIRFYKKHGLTEEYLLMGLEFD